MKEKVCPLAWQHISTTTSGTIRLCCNSENSMNKAISDKGKALKVYRDDFDEALNTDVYKKTRLSMLNGELPAVCDSCLMMEENGLNSPREFYKDHFNFTEEKAKQLTSADGSLREKADVRYLDLRLGNLCNLQCRMCNPWSSSALNSQMMKVFNHEDVGLLDWPDRDTQWIDKILDLSNLEEVYLTGGEPSIIDNNKNLLRLLYSKFGKSLRIKINSNLQVYDKEFFDLLSSFDDVHFKASIDCYGPINDYVRYPSRFSEISQNLEKVLQYDFKCEIHTTVQIYNFFHIPKWLVYCNEKKWPKVHLFHLSYPECLDIQILPKTIWTEFIDFNSLELKQLNQIEYDQVMDFKNLIGNKYSQKALEEFYHYTSKLDDERYSKEYWSSLCPVNLK